ncbi:hypothetical protein B0J17DRAFT_630997 [Rhizoctonia solani]|nr:hypothetical protein B0J17DRAFT_630997 [Rhizoctonia solani]
MSKLPQPQLPSEPVLLPPTPVTRADSKNNSGDPEESGEDDFDNLPDGDKHLGPLPPGSSSSTLDVVTGTSPGLLLGAPAISNTLTAYSNSTPNGLLPATKMLNITKSMGKLSWKTLGLTEHPISAVDFHDLANFNASSPPALPSSSQSNSSGDLEDVSDGNTSDEDLDEDEKAMLATAVAAAKLKAKVEVKAKLKARGKEGKGKGKAKRKEKGKGKAKVMNDKHKVTENAHAYITKKTATSNNIPIGDTTHINEPKSTEHPPVTPGQKLRKNLSLCSQILPLPCGKATNCFTTCTSCQPPKANQTHMGQLPSHLRLKGKPHHIQQ